MKKKQYWTGNDHHLQHIKPVNKASVIFWRAVRLQFCHHFVPESDLQGL